MSSKIDERGSAQMPESTPADDDIIIMEDVCKSFGKTQALIDASLRVKRGEVCLIFGPSGGGKSTILE